MDPLSSSLETLILSDRGVASLSIVSHLWTWVAVLTAAISLWRIKAVTSAAPSRKNEPLQKAPSPEKPDGGKRRHLQTPPSPVAVRSDTVSVSPASESNSGSLDFCMNGGRGEEGYKPSTEMGRSPSGRFFQRWEDDSECVSEMARRVGSILCDEGSGKFAVYFDGDGSDGGDGFFGATEGFRLCELGSWVDADNCAIACGLPPLVGSAAEWPWYRHLDLTVLDGNVVRLWDDVSGRRPPIGWAGASRQVVSLF